MVFLICFGVDGDAQAEEEELFLNGPVDRRLESEHSHTLRGLKERFSAPSEIKGLVEGALP